jgi:hypothetical protein
VDDSVNAVDAIRQRGNAGPDYRFGDATYSGEPMTWTHEQAVDLCTMIEQVAPRFGCHVALTGGLLYKDGPRKDCDLLIYRIRQCPAIDMLGLWTALKAEGLVKKSGFGWCYKAVYTTGWEEEFAEKPVDIFFPEAPRNPDGTEMEYRK